MPLITIFSDIHVHKHSGSVEKMDECLRCLDWIYAKSIARGADAIVFAGDLLHDRNRISVDAYVGVYDILKRYKGLIPSYYLMGNHDMYYSSQWTVSALNPLADVVEVIDRPTTVEIAGLPIDFVPYLRRTADVREMLPRRSKVLVSHLAVENAVVNTLWGVKYQRENELVENIEEIEGGVFDGYERVYLGHFHAYQEMGPVTYVGSPLQLTFGEAFDEKGFLEFDTETLRHERVLNDISPKYLILPETEELRSEDIEGNYVQLVMAECPASMNVTEYKREFATKFGSKSIELKFASTSKAAPEAEAIVETARLVTDPKTMARKFIEAIEGKLGLDPARLIEMGNKIIDTADLNITELEL